MDPVTTYGQHPALTITTRLLIAAALAWALINSWHFDSSRTLLIKSLVFAFLAFIGWRYGQAVDDVHCSDTHIAEANRQLAWEAIDWSRSRLGRWRSVLVSYDGKTTMAFAPALRRGGLLEKLQQRRAAAGY